MQGNVRGSGGRMFSRGYNGRCRGNLSFGGQRSSRALEGTPEHFVKIGKFMHDCEDEMVFQVTSLESIDLDKTKHSGKKMIPYFNSIIYLENKKRIGKVDEVFGPINDIMFTVKPDSGILSKSFVKDDEVYIGSEKLLPISRFTDPKNMKISRSDGRGVRKGRVGVNAGRFSASKNGISGRLHIRGRVFRGRGGRIGGKRIVRR